MANGRSVAHVYSIMEELQQLRGKVSTLSEKNRQLAKALNTAKQEVVKAKVTQNAVFSDKVVEWMEMRFKPGGVRDQSTQCTIREEIAGDSREGCLCLENIQLEPDSPFSPHWDNRPKSPRLSSPIVATATRKKAYTRNMHAKITEVAGTQRHLDSGEDACEDVLGIDNGAGAMDTISELDIPRLVPASNSIGTSDAQGTIETQATCKQEILSPRYHSRSARLNKQVDGHSRLRQRDARMSYAEPKLNTKLRRGDYYGLGVRANRQGKECQSLKHRMISDTHKVKSGFKSAPFGQHCSPFHKRATRHVKRISYVEPKLNSKLRQGDKFTFTT